MTFSQAVIAAKAAWKAIVKPLSQQYARMRVALARRREAAKRPPDGPTQGPSAVVTACAILALVAACSGCARFDKAWIWADDNFNVSGTNAPAAVQQR